MEPALETFSSIRRSIVVAIKRGGPQPIDRLAEILDVTYEAVRQQVVQLQREGWIERVEVQRSTGKPGRPQRLFRLTAAGDHLFAKNYADLAVEIIDTVAELDPASLKKVLESLTAARVRRWQPLLEGLSLEERLGALREIYQQDDPFTVVESTDGGGLRLVERNCPFLDVARRRPALCSVTVSTLTQVLGYRVIREEKFQNGDGCCAFRILTDQPIGADSGFELESATD